MTAGHYRVRLDGSVAGYVAHLQDDYENWHWLAYRHRDRDLPLGVFSGGSAGKVAAVKAVVEYDRDRRRLDALMAPPLTGRSARMSLFEVTQDSTSKAA